ncbi:hypothetical protein FRZ67_14990 [Panacibacter ginsenosidivorans]|uniref:Cytochrome C Planctomycete-type domain-containing protein n=1 Tax=Panacibacter ginsenosidivorans TaxID=1813871 RepID=A0A5B8VAP7_9BACT|nr:c-type cytochrome domain-containing protein [Panacibacter ginsenosidivorans]QEC68547.1 hypothetical protein FRZ67_14990 [Panacibacter ginsenosidivorans]
MKKLFSLLTLCVLIFSCRHQIANPYGDTTKICFEEQVLPIFQSSCAQSGCHDESSHQGGYVLDSYDNIIKQGIVSGDANKSEIVKSLTGFLAGKMPQSPVPALSAVQIQFIATWINQGAINTTGCETGCNPEVYTYSGAIEPLVKTYCLGCHYSATSENKNVDLSSYEAIKTQVDNDNFRASVNHDDGLIPMPQNADKLSDCKLSQIDKWIKAGALHN